MYCTVANINYCWRHNGCVLSFYLSYFVDYGVCLDHLQAGKTPLEVAKLYIKHSVADYLEKVGKHHCTK